MHRLRIARNLIRIARMLVASRRSHVRLFIDENQSGIIPGLKALGYNNIKTFPSGTPDQVIHDSMNEIQKGLNTKHVFFVTGNPEDFTEAARGSEPKYNVIAVPGSVLAEDVPALLDSFISRKSSSLGFGERGDITRP